MSEVNENKKKTKHTNNYVKTFRSGAVAANVFSRQAPGGFEYLDFSLSRAWKTAGGKEGYSQNFFAGNEEALHTVIEQASDFIDAHGAVPQESQREEKPDATKTRAEAACNPENENSPGESSRPIQRALQDARNRSLNGRFPEGANPTTQPTK